MSAFFTWYVLTRQKIDDNYPIFDKAQVEEDQQAGITDRVYVMVVTHGEKQVASSMLHDIPTPDGYLAGSKSCLFISLFFLYNK